MHLERLRPCVVLAKNEPTGSSRGRIRRTRPTESKNGSIIALGSRPASLRRGFHALRGMGCVTHSVHGLRWLVRRPARSWRPLVTKQLAKPPVTPIFLLSTHSRWSIGLPEKAPTSATCTKTCTSRLRGRKRPRRARTGNSPNRLIIEDLDWCREGGSNPHGREGRRILSPLRLPVPPSRRVIQVLSI